MRPSPAPAGTGGLAELAGANAPVGLGLFTRSGICLYANAALARLLGVADPASLVGRSTERFNGGSRTLRELVRERMGAQPRAETILDLLRADGHPLRGHATLELTTGPGGRTAVAVALAESLPAPDADASQSRKMEAITRFAAGLAHEFNNVLTALMTEAGALHEGLPPGSSERASALGVLETARRAAALARRLVVLGGAEVKCTGTVDLAAALLAVRGRLDPPAPGVAVEWRADARVGPVRVDPHDLDEILRSLLANAADALPAGGRIVVETGSASAPADTEGLGFQPPVPPGRYAWLSVGDNGVGMTSETRTRAFDPFFTTKPRGEGSGLGLATVYGQVARARGHVAVMSAPGHGTLVRILLPIAEDAGHDLLTAPPSPPPELGRLRALVVDDEEPVRRAIARVLERMGFEVLEAADAAEARSIVRERPDPIQILVTDVMMPRVLGTGLAAWVSAERPDTSILLVSGFADNPEIQRWVDDDPDVFLAKPFEPTELVERVRRRLALA